MCGIAGLLAKRQRLREALGRHFMPILDCMGSRGEDSAGYAIFGLEGSHRWRRFNLMAPAGNADWERISAGPDGDGARVEGFTVEGDNHAILRARHDTATLAAWLEAEHPEVHLLSSGHVMDVYKDVGHPRQVAERYGLGAARGSHAIGHTRMATESAVTPAHAHPFVAGPDFALVHNGSLSNPHMIRRMLERKGMRFVTDNDTEAAARLIQWRLEQGEDLEAALHYGFEIMDGFYTLLLANDREMAIVRDSFACKPAVVAETDAYVAIASEYRGVADLPDIENARLFEPAPEEIYVWAV